MTSMLPLLIIIKHPETSYSHYALWHIIYQFSSVQSLSRVQLFVTPWTAAHQVSHQKLPELTQTHVHRVGDAIQPSHPLLSPSPPAFNLSQHHSLFQRVNSSDQLAKSVSPSNEYSGLISFRIDWFDLLEVQGTLKSLLQHHSSKVKILQGSAFFIVQLVIWVMKIFFV